MNLGKFSLSINVSDLVASKNFYEKIGFSVIAGKIELDYLILKNNDTIIGLYQDMISGNIITFNPGKDTENSIQDIQNELIGKGVELYEKVESINGPGRLVVYDPDGNRIEIEQGI